jgi:hypothetical protein
MSWIDAIKNGRVDFPNEINEIGGDADPEVIISRLQYWIECGYDISLFQEINLVSYLGRSEQLFFKALEMGMDITMMNEVCSIYSEKFRNFQIIIILQFMESILTYASLHGNLPIVETILAQDSGHSLLNVANSVSLVE